jgi:superfamily II DNA or RNA helicase
VPEDYGEKPAIHEIWEALINDDNRQRMIAEDVKDVLVSGRFPLIISDRKEHLASLSSRIRESTDGISAEEFMLTGDMGKKLRKKALDDIYVLQGSDTRPYILSTASLIGEGFDLPDLDTLFITMPVSFKGRVVQYAGRLHRDTGSKRDIIIYDYCDSSLGLTVSMFKKRLSAYREMGYEIILPECGKITRMVKKSR